MQSASSRVWTHVAVSISYDDNHYTTGTSMRMLTLLSEDDISLPKNTNWSTRGWRYDEKNSTILIKIADFLVSLWICISIVVGYFKPNPSLFYSKLGELQGFMPFLRVFVRKLMEFGLAYNDFTIKFGNHYDTGAPPLKQIRFYSVIEKERNKCRWLLPSLLTVDTFA